MINPIWTGALISGTLIVAGASVFVENEWMMQTMFAGALLAIAGIIGSSVDHLFHNHEGH